MTGTAGIGPFGRSEPKGIYGSRFHIYYSFTFASQAARSHAPFITGMATVSDKAGSLSTYMSATGSDNRNSLAPWERFLSSHRV